MDTTDCGRPGFTFSLPLMPNLHFTPKDMADSTYSPNISHISQRMQQSHTPQTPKFSPCLYTLAESDLESVCYQENDIDQTMAKPARYCLRSEKSTTDTIQAQSEQSRRKTKLSKRSRVVQKRKQRSANLRGRCRCSSSRLHRDKEPLARSVSAELTPDSLGKRQGAPRDKDEGGVVRDAARGTGTQSPDSGIGSDHETLSRQSSTGSVCSTTSTLSTVSTLSTASTCSCLSTGSTNSTESFNSVHTINGPTVCPLRKGDNVLTTAGARPTNCGTQQQADTSSQRTVPCKPSMGMRWADVVKKGLGQTDSQSEKCDIVITNGASKTSVNTNDNVKKTPVKTSTKTLSQTPKKTPKKTFTKTPKKSSKTPVKTPKRPTTSTPTACPTTPVSTPRTPRRSLFFSPRTFLFKASGSSKKSNCPTPETSFTTSTPLSASGTVPHGASGSGVRVPTAADFIPKKRLSVGQQLRRRLTDTPRRRTIGGIFTGASDSATKGKRKLDRKPETPGSTPRRRFTPTKRKVRLLSCLSSPATKGMSSSDSFNVSGYWY